jgi:hypothetical protein
MHDSSCLTREKLEPLPLPVVIPFFSSLAEKYTAGHPEIDSQFSGFWSDGEQELNVHSLGNVRRGGNQYRRWWTFDAECTGSDGERLPIRQVRVSVARIP